MKAETYLLKDYHRVPANAEFINYWKRLSSFQNHQWPGVQKHEDMAIAGFYYCLREDCVKCFWCDVGLYKWEPEDKPWVEHAKAADRCSYLIFVKGTEFVCSIKYSASVYDPIFRKQ